MKTRTLVSRFVGGIQCGLGAIASVLAYLLYANPSMQEMLSIAQEEVFLYMFLLLVFSMLSILSGLLLVREGDSRK